MQSFVVLDLETTGFRVAGDSIVEIAAVRFVPGKGIVEEMQMLVKPRVEVHPGALAAHGITTTEAREKGREPKDALEALLRFIGDDPVVAHNGLSFDFRMLLNHFQFAGLTVGKNRLLDTLMLASKYLKTNSGRFSLAALCETFSIANPDAHRALSDSRATAKVLELVLNEQPDHNELWEDSAGNLWNALVTLPEGFELLEQAISQDLVLELEYASVGKPPSQRMVMPLALAPGNGRTIYFRALCMRDNVEKSFRIDRIIRLIDVKQAA